MDDDARRGIEWDATRHVLRFYRALDERTPGSSAAYFDEHGTWERMGTPHHGRAAIDAALAARDPQLAIRHVVSNLVADVEDADHVTVTSYVTVFLDRDAGEGPGRLAAPKSIWANTTTLVRREAGWRITRHGGRIVMTRPDIA
ncbi:nuclear transport factor 2 family protein [Actinomycetospora sp. TBRC 11914]|uniref:nuclear transport factor 2 family protein n=1 Tax=Actinomycetospora sp. TBRC 11914 TaxID=2729387 RepID=UPI00145E3781|nr:nuclear transport factor 2 family protein [Actinomycetospora sp. TBRC 11914]NMO91714.1 SnoaL-like domain-containing protein [Actinomycetospora sp. TBRC 11914]